MQKLKYLNPKFLIEVHCVPHPYSLVYGTFLKHIWIVY